MTLDIEYFVRVYSHVNNEVIKEIGPLRMKQAERVDDGMQHNLNHDLYYTLVEEGARVD